MAKTHASPITALEASLAGGTARLAELACSAEPYGLLTAALVDPEVARGEVDLRPGLAREPSPMVLSKG